MPRQKPMFQTNRMGCTKYTKYYKEGSSATTFFWKFHLSITSCNNLIWCTNYPKGSFILYVRKIFRKTNIFYPWYAHVRCFSETFAYVLNEGSQISILILLVSAWVSFEGVFSLWVLALYFPFYRKKWSPKRLVH